MTQDVDRIEKARARLELACVALGANGMEALARLYAAHGKGMVARAHRHLVWRLALRPPDAPSMASVAAAQRMSHATIWQALDALPDVEAESAHPVLARLERRYDALRAGKPHKGDGPAQDEIVEAYTTVRGEKQALMRDAVMLRVDARVLRLLRAVDEMDQGALRRSVAAARMQDGTEIPLRRLLCAVEETGGMGVDAHRRPE